MKKLVPYIKQESRYTCSLAVLRMVLSFYDIQISEEELVDQVKPIYGSKFKNIWNPTIAKLACEFGLKVTFSANWPLLEPRAMKKAIREYHQFGLEMDVDKYKTLPIPSNSQNPCRLLIRRCLLPSILVVRLKIKNYHKPCY